MANTNKYLEKASSLLAGAALTHIGQNLVTKGLLNSKTYAKSVAKSFSEGVHGVTDKSRSTAAKNFVAGIVSPDAAIAKNEAHKLGQTLAPHIKGLNKRQQVGLRMMSEGRFDDIVKHRLHEDPALLAASKAIGSHTGIDAHKMLKDAPQHAGRLKETFGRKDLPLLSNVTKHLSRGGKPTSTTVGAPSTKSLIAGSISAGVLDPAAGLINSAKSLASSDKFKNTALGGKLTSKVQEMLIKSPIKKGLDHPSISMAKNKIMEVAVNPVSAHLQRTTNALKNIGGK